MATTTLPGTRPGIEITGDTDEQLDPPFHLILLDDDEHTYQYVIHMLGEVFGYSKEKGFAIACMVDANGQAILLTASARTSTSFRWRSRTYVAR